MMNADPFIADYTSAQDFNRYSYVRNNPLKFTDPGGYNYMIDGMEVSERAFFNYWKNMSGTEMYIEMVGSWDNAASVWFLHQTSITETITEESAFLTNSWYGYAQNPGEFGFLPTTSKNRTNIWSGNLGSAGIVNYGGKPSYSFLMGDNLIGLFSLKTRTQGRLVTIDDLERWMKMSEEGESPTMSFYIDGSISFGPQLGGKFDFFGWSAGIHAQGPSIERNMRLSINYNLENGVSFGFETKAINITKASSWNVPFRSQSVKTFGEINEHKVFNKVQIIDRRGFEQTSILYGKESGTHPYSEKISFNARAGAGIRVLLLGLQVEMGFE